MSYCKFCGKEIGDARFCPHCGKEQQTAPAQTTGGRRLHCPKCRCEQLTAVTEASQIGGFATTSRLTRNTGVTTYSANTVNRHFWMCRDCGHKFRNLEDLDAELETESKRVKWMNIPSILLGIACLLSVLLLFSVPKMLRGVFVPFLLAILGFTALWLWACYSVKKQVEQMAADKAYLEENCFN